VSKLCFLAGTRQLYTRIASASALLQPVKLLMGSLDQGPELVVARLCSVELLLQAGQHSRRAGLSYVVGT
jgi:hypothetical protein